MVPSEPGGFTVTISEGGGTTAIDIGGGAIGVEVQRFLEMVDFGGERGGEPQEPGPTPRPPVPTPRPTPSQAPSCDPRGNSGSSSSGGTGPAAGQLAHTGARVGTGARILTGVGAVAGTATGGTAFVLIGIGTLGYLVMNRGPKSAPDNNPHPPKPSTCPTPLAPEAKDKWHCTASCNIENFSNVPNAPLRVTGAGSGSSEVAACANAKSAAVASAPRGTYARHCQCQCSKR